MLSTLLNLLLSRECINFCVLLQIQRLQSRSGEVERDAETYKAKLEDARRDVSILRYLVTSRYIISNVLLPDLYVCLSVLLLSVLCLFVT